jgi:flagellar biosynthetic protein FlhB
VVAVAGDLGARLGGRLALAAVAIGVLDYLWQRHRHRQSLRMTREEVKRERKEVEGDPLHKAERQRLHREALEQRRVGDVREADFVVVNPDHVAVAVRYDRGGPSAPVVVAKGERLLAERIKEIAREAGVPIFRDVALARSLRDVEEGAPIPETLYDAVAEILRLVYRAEAPRPGAGAEPGPGAFLPRGGWGRG